MNNDLAQISKSGGIYRTLALLSILALKPAVNGTASVCRNKGILQMRSFNGVHRREGQMHSSIEIEGRKG